MALTIHPVLCRSCQLAHLMERLVFRVGGCFELCVSVAEFRATALNSCYRSGATPTTSPNLLSKSEEDRL